MTVLLQAAASEGIGLGLGLSMAELYGVLGGAGIVIVLAAWGLAEYAKRTADIDVDASIEQAIPEEGGAHALSVDPPEVTDSMLGLMAAWRHRRKEKRLARKGYLKWYKIGSNRRRPVWVKPTHDGQGVPQYYDKEDDVTYLFPTGALVTDSRTGAWVAEHRIGEAEPINLREPAYPPLDADRLEEVINLEAESDAPSFFDRFGLDTTTMMWGLIGVAFIGFAAYRQMGGGAA